MRRGTRITISLLLKIFLLGSSLPMLLASPVWAQECTEEEIKTNLHRLESRFSVDINSAYKLFDKCGSRSLKYLITILQDPTEKLDVKYDAAFALGQIGSGSKEAVNALIAFLQDSKIDPLYRAWAAEALGKIGVGSKEAVHALIAFLQDPNPKISSIDRNTILKALGQIGSESEEAGNAVVAFLQKPEASFENCQYLCQFMKVEDL